MDNKLGFSLQLRNPDILTSIANLSNDEVFTPPAFANRMLDTLAESWAQANNGADIWADSAVTFLDPFTKSGVFLREITGRLSDGLEKEIPDIQDRIDHILTRQVFGVAITELTSLLARRSVYCSKWANGEHSIASEFTTPEGNIWFERTEHTWVGGKERVITVDDGGNEVEVSLGGKCKHCGAPRRTMDRGQDLESHAYPFLHLNQEHFDSGNLFGAKMKFDVIVGNPPYHMTGGGGGSNDSSIYHLFVNQAKNLEPRFITMVIPSRWIAGGRGLDRFRSDMLSDRSVRYLVDYPLAKEAFPGQKIEGGVCFFLRDAAYEGDCSVTVVRDGVSDTQKHRRLDEFDVLIREEESLGILRKVTNHQEPSLIDLVSGDTPFGLATNFRGFRESGSDSDLQIHLVDKGKRKTGFLSHGGVIKNTHLIDVWKVFVPEAYGVGALPQRVLGTPIAAGKASVCTQSFLVVGPFQSRSETLNFESYYRTRFFRFLVSLRKISQHALRSTYTWVPQQDWGRVWTDEELYAKYGITEGEIAFIESMIRPMELAGE
jgi:site-specific DNA-methyltransferase (adenine-specific)